MVIRAIPTASLTGLMLAATATPGAASPDAPFSQVYTVMNTDEQLPDGVYMRGFASDDTAEKVVGFGVYKNEQIRAYCYAIGDPGGQFGNRVWYLADNITRPTVNGLANTGYINTHYVSDGQSANSPDPRLPEC